MCPLGPVAFNIFGIGIRWYGILISLGMILGLYLAMYRAKKYGENPDFVTDLALVSIPAGILGARLYYVAFEWQNYVGNPMEVFNYRAGGLAIHGGLFFGAAAFIIYSKLKKINTWRFADIITPSIPLGQAIGRWGNYINGEAHGGPTNLPWAILVDGVKVHPTFLYESLWNIGIFLLLIFVFDKRKKFDGELICIYGILYSVGRFFIEGLRTDSLMFFGLRTAQLVSLLIILFLSVILYLKLKTVKNKK